jgi:hypothetical protein
VQDWRERERVYFKRRRRKERRKEWRIKREERRGRAVLCCVLF